MAMLCRLLLALLLLPLPAAGQSIDGRWSGAAVVGGTVQLFDLDLKTVDDSLQAVLTQPYSGFVRFSYPVAYADGRLVLGLFGDRMELHVQAAEDAMRGTVTRADTIFATVHLQRVLARPRPGYRTEEITLVSNADTLSGALLLPDGSGPHPAIVYVHGRGYGSRGEMYEYANILVQHGVAGLVFDGRGSGRSTGSRDATTDADRFADVHAALDLLAERSDIRHDQTGLLSGSAGGWVIPVVAAERTDVAFLVTLVGPAESLADQQGHVVEYLMRYADAGFSEEDYRAAFTYQKALVELTNRDAPWSDFAALIDEARRQPWWEYVDQPDDLDNSEIDYYRRRKAFDPVPALRRTTVPFLALFGERDYVVPPEVNVPKLERYLTEAGNEDLTIVVLDGVGHNLGRPSGRQGQGAWPEGFYRWWHRPAALYETLVAWVLNRVDVAQR